LQNERWFLLESVAVASILLIVVSLSIIPSAYSLSLSPAQSTVIHVADPDVCKAHPVLTKDLAVKKVSGRPLTDDAYAGRQHIVEALLSAECYGATDKNGNYPFLLLIEIRDSDGITQQFVLQQGTIEPWTEMTVGFSWIPDRPGEYEIRSFSLPDENSRFFMANILHTTVEVVQG
jgi:hypothetical protein